MEEFNFYNSENDGYRGGFGDYVDPVPNTPFQPGSRPPKKKSGAAKVVALVLACTIAGGTGTVQEALQEKILTIGENLKIRRFARYEGTVETYVHGGGRIGVMVRFEVEGTPDTEKFLSYSKDIAMQVAAATPTYLDKTGIPEEVIAHEKEVLTKQAIDEGKPANIAEKMVMGRINKFYKEVCLVEQPFIKDGDISVTQFTETTAKELGVKIRIVDFVRFEKGEGLEKREDNFADEVASMIK